MVMSCSHDFSIQSSRVFVDLVIFFAPSAMKRSSEYSNFNVASSNAAGSAERPATLVDKVKQLGHYPKRFKKPKTDKERAENSLADKISKQWSSLDDATQAELTRLRQPASAEQPAPGKASAAQPESEKSLPLSELNKASAKTGGEWLVCAFHPVEDIYQYTWQGKSRQGTNLIVTLVSAEDASQYCQGLFKKMRVSATEIISSFGTQVDSC